MIEVGKDPDEQLARFGQRHLVRIAARGDSGVEHVLEHPRMNCQVDFVDFELDIAARCTQVLQLEIK